MTLSLSTYKPKNPENHTEEKPAAVPLYKAGGDSAEALSTPTMGLLDI